LVKGGVPENFDPKKGGVFENFDPKKGGVFENFRRPPLPILQGGGVHLNNERSLRGGGPFFRAKTALGVYHHDHVKYANFNACFIISINIIQLDKFRCSKNQCMSYVRLKYVSICYICSLILYRTRWINLRMHEGLIKTIRCNCVL